MGLKAFSLSTQGMRKHVICFRPLAGNGFERAKRYKLPFKGLDGFRPLAGNGFESYGKLKPCPQSCRVSVPLRGMGLKVPDQRHHGRLPAGFRPLAGNGFESNPRVRSGSARSGFRPLAGNGFESLLCSYPSHEHTRKFPSPCGEWV